MRPGYSGRRLVTGGAGFAGDGTAAAQLGDVCVAARLLRPEQHLALAGDDGFGAREVDRTIALRGAGGVGESAGLGSDPGSAHVTRKIAGLVPGKGTGGALERGVGQTMDGPAAGSRADVLRGWTCSCVPRPDGTTSATLCGASEIVSARHGGLLGQCAGRPTLRLHQPGERSRLGAGA